mgnify:CR=1 FL=1
MLFRLTRFELILFLPVFGFRLSGFSAKSPPGAYPSRTIEFFSGFFAEAFLDLGVFWAESISEEEP